MIFERFALLPPELQIQIWEDALRVPTVWAATRNYEAGNSSDRGHTPICKRFIGPEPYLAGLACRESRRLLEQSFGQPLRGQPGSATTLGAYWVHLDTTVIYLGDTATATEILETWDVSEVRRFRLVALSDFALAAISHIRFTTLAKVCQRLATSCPNLHTIIIHRVETNLEGNGTISGHLSRGMADLYARIPEESESEICRKESSSLYLASLLGEYFGDGPPKIHLLSPEYAVPSP